LGWTQVEAAAACGLDIKFYQDVEYGRRPVTTRTLFVVAAGLDTTLGTLSRGAEEPSPGSAPPGGNNPGSGNGHGDDAGDRE
jgi:transcriptional regulator with XRE-family HTH domain